MVVYVGIDDTDSAKGMCTTYLLTEVIRELEFPVLFGYPRLVRLNPNVPWKTRGNGALALALGGDAGAAFRIGEIEGREVLASFRSSAQAPAPDMVMENVSSVIGRLAALSDENTNPGVAVSQCRPSQELYWSAVRDIVPPADATRALSEAGGISRQWKNGRGLIGATAAIAWVPVDRTYEVIAYRKPWKWGTGRCIDSASVARLSQHFPSTFSNYDTINRHVCIAPSSPCPVLFGIRGDDPAVLEGAMRSVDAEDHGRWLLFETNQGTDDHIEDQTERLALFHSYMLMGTVARDPWTVRGGHVFFSLKTPSGETTCAAFEETKELRRPVKSLLPGDTVAVWGSLKPGVEGESLNIEKIEVISLVARRLKEANPLCPVCRKRMKSAGKDSGYRCRICHTRRAEAEYRIAQRFITPGLYSVATSSRRHLSKPPERMRMASLTMARPSGEAVGGAPTITVR